MGFHSPSVSFRDWKNNFGANVEHISFKICRKSFLLGLLLKYSIARLHCKIHFKYDPLISQIVTQNIDNCRDVFPKSEHFSRSQLRGSRVRIYSNYSAGIRHYKPNIVYMSCLEVSKPFLLMIKMSSTKCRERTFNKVRYSNKMSSTNHRCVQVLQDLVQIVTKAK